MRTFAAIALCLAAAGCTDAHTLAGPSGEVSPMGDEAAVAADELELHRANVEASATLNELHDAELLGLSSRPMEMLTILRMWAGAAWADGELHPAEEAALRRLIDASEEELGKDGKATALALLSAPPVVKPEEVGKLASASREGVYRAALGIVRLDGKVTGDEEAWVVRLRERLNLDPAVLAKIDAEFR